MAGNLSDRGIRSKPEGWHADGGGLYLRVLKAKGDQPPPRRWVFVFQWGGKRAEMGMGSYPDVSLADAREGDFGRDWARGELKAHRNPIEERRRLREEAQAAAEPPPAVKTFATWAEEVAPAVGPKEKKARAAWVRMMKDKTGALAAMAPADVQTEHVLAAIKPYWTSRPEMGKRMRQRIFKVLGAARSGGGIPQPVWENPARLDDHLENLLPKRNTTVKHRAALPYVEMATFMSELRALERPAAPAVEWTILTVVRNVEARAVRKREIDLKTKIWTVPAERMKGEEGQKREHRVPITPAMERLLQRIGFDDLGPDELLFKPYRSKTPIMSENALQDVVKEMGYQGRATVHGFRSTFKTWASECTNFPYEVSEMALAHVVGDDTERAYNRTDLLQKRVKLMQAWANFLDRPAPEVAVLGDARRGGGDVG